MAVGTVVVGEHLVSGLRQRRTVRWQPGHGRVHRGTLAARVLGDQGTPVVLLHGQAGSGRYWGHAYDQLATRRQIIVPDLLGFGDSPRPDGPYDADRHADAVLACLDELGITAPAVVVAHSLGCIVALRLATRRPDRVRAVLGFGPPLYANADDARAHLTGMGIGTRLFVMDTTVAKAAYNVMCGRHPRLAGALASLVRLELPAPIAHDAVRYSWHSYSDTLRRLIVAAPAVSWLSDLQVPVHFVVGNDDLIPHGDLLLELAATHPLLTIELWPNGGHHLPLTDPKGCVAAIRAVLAPVERGHP